MDQQSGKTWRRRLVRGAVIGVVLAGIGGVGWAATRATNPGVISACVEPASSQMFYTATGTCPGGQTLVSWDEQGQPGMTGQQGPPGASAASAATTAFGPSKYTNGFTISAEADTRGNYEFSGTIQNEQVTTGPHNATFFVRCALLAGPPNGTATELTESTTYYVYNRHKRAFQPSGFDGPDALSFVDAVSATQVPLVVYYTCKRVGLSGKVIFTHPALTLTAARALHLKVGPALPIHQTVGPGPLRILNGH